MFDSNILWYELTKYNYIINILEIEIQLNNIQINIYFNNLDDIYDLVNCIYNKYYYKINNIEEYNNNILLNLSVKKNTIDFFEKLEYPKNVNSIKILIDSLSSKLVNDKYKNIINIPNLPINLYQLKIISNCIFNLSNLPLKLFLLDISECECKFCLDYLSNNLKILYLPSFKKFNSTNDYLYDFKDFENLPTSINEIVIDDFIFDSSVKLIDKLNIKY